ncbi:MAG: hypothetical protein CFE28_04055 [Alphaproteobacteria bacterium PA2]|nr:MAG: hypothetical protein CFE28_04055 [Alphaproteobacteria bacterium PA2]
MKSLPESLGLEPVAPVLIIEDETHAVPLAGALVAGGLFALEVTLRTPAALASIERIAAEVEGCEVGARTVLNRHMLDAMKAGDWQRINSLSREASRLK